MRMARQLDIDKLVERVKAVSARLARVPEGTRRLADQRQDAVRRLVAACDGNAREAARQLKWPPPNVYRILSGDRGSKRRAKAKES